MNLSRQARNRCKLYAITPDEVQAVLAAPEITGVQANGLAFATATIPGRFGGLPL